MSKIFFRQPSIEKSQNFPTFQHTFSKLHRVDKIFDFHIKIRNL